MFNCMFKMLKQKLQHALNNKKIFIYQSYILVCLLNNNQEIVDSYLKHVLFYKYPTIKM